MSDKKWKQGLLSSGVPLEFEVARILQGEEFDVNLEFSYDRIDEGQSKDFSVDVEASAPIELGRSHFGLLQVLVECKYRTPGKTWLFLPNHFVSGEGLKVLDQFGVSRIPRDALVHFNYGIPSGCRGVEIAASKGEVNASEIKHGLCQLQYALPELIYEDIDHSATEFTEVSYPYYLTGILVTTADLRIARSDVSIDRVSNAANLEDISQSCPYITAHQPFGPDFVRHAVRRFRTLKREEIAAAVVEMEKCLVGKLASSLFARPSVVIRGLADGTWPCYRSYFTDFLVCTLSGLPQLLEEIQQATRSSLRRETKALDLRRTRYGRQGVRQFVEMLAYPGMDGRL